MNIRKSRVWILCTPIGLIALAGCGPAITLSGQPNFYDNRPPEAPAVESITERGTIILSDGREVRLFGVRIPEDNEERERFVRSLKEWERRHIKMDVEEITEDVVPAAHVTAYRQVYFCSRYVRSADRKKEPLYEQRSVVEVWFMNGMMAEPDRQELFDPRFDGRPYVESLRSAVKYHDERSRR